eukprot:tig00000144_g9099.t1
MAVDPTNRPQIIDHAVKSITYTVFDTRWVPRSARFVALGTLARGTGCIQIYQLNQGKLELQKEIEKQTPFKCGTFHASREDDRRLATGDFDGRMSIWDLEKSELPTYTVKAHGSLINCIDGCGGFIGKGAPEVVTGSRDGCVRVWDPRQKDEPCASLEPADDATKRDCWTVGFGNSHTDEERCVVAGYDNGDVKLWDLRTNSVRWECNVKNGVVSLEFDRKDIEMNKIVATTLEGNAWVWDCRTQHPEKGFASLTEKVQQSTLWCVRHLPQNREVFGIGGGDGSLTLYKYKYPEQRSKKDFKGNPEGVIGSVEQLQTRVLAQQPICSLDWSPDKEGLAVMGAFDQTIRVSIVTKLNKI